ncbi:hypothetical protein LUZ63_013506 [Rhynchospora breviuscula]|uniref:Uncharacterized protein n=1 Tax=Rhynchospora breviuscula TaxID=2022672 RepID=A0A9Q0HKA3_9POAL|nr:hypothetical protein LUZ63_013506 [Rhynchospora breviuscula]
MELLKAAAYLVPWVDSKVAKHVAYPFKLSSNIRTLESTLEELLARKRDVKTEILNAQRENGAPTEQINLWLKEVEAIEQKAEETHQKYQQLCRCIWNISPNLWLNYKISKRAAKKHEEVINLYKKKETIPVIIHMPPPLAQEMPASSSKSSNLESALQDIRDDVHNIIGIWGMGGIGKTHLLKQINNELSRDRVFEVVVFVTCSKDCYDEKIQNEIINRIGLSKDGSMEQKQCTIYNFLKERSFVLLLDDLWDRVNLDKIGIPDPMEAVHTCKRKIVLTTRSTEVCRQMEVMKKIKVDILNWDDAWSLFIEKVTEKTINSDLLIKKYAVDVVNELGGLPLALITIGRAMRDKTDRYDWEEAIMQLKQARLDDVEWSRANPSVFHMLKFSYDSLKNDTLRRCFLHCSLWPEDFSIRKDRLIELWMGLGLIDKPDIQAAYTIGYTYVNNLQSVCLLETDGFNVFLLMRGGGESDSDPDSESDQSKEVGLFVQGEVRGEEEVGRRDEEKLV